VVRMLLYFDKRLFTEQLPKYIAQGLRAQTQLEGLTGAQYISLDFLEPSRYQVRRHPYPWVPANPVIPSAPSLTNEILESIENFFAGLSDMHLDSKFKDTLPAIQALILQLDRFAAGITGETANEVLGNIDNFLKTTDGKVTDFDMQKINNMVKSLDASAKEISTLAQGPETQELVNQINALSDKFNGIATGNEYSIRRLMNSLVQVTQSLADFTRQLNNNPGLFIQSLTQ
ncbi:MAG: hypothetical protein LUC43_09625, partial [Burkholderiales bacterium]|nr:hypothetical protein [Burkholderiales bacterium]